MVEQKTGGFPVPDINFSTSAETVKSFITESNQEGLDYYRDIFFVVDIFFPFFLCAFLVLSLNGLTGKLFPKWSARKLILFLPIIGMVFDYIESIGIVTLIFSSEYSQILAQLIVIFFKLKMLFGISSLLLVIINAIFLGVQSAYKNRTSRQ